VTIVRAWPPRVIALGLAAAVLAAACGATSPSTAPSTAPSGGATASAGTSAAADASGSAPAPSSTPWPGNVPDAIIGLGAIDAQLAAAGQAMDAAVQAKDVAAMVGAADGLVVLIDAYGKYVAIAQGYPATRPLADTYAGAFEKLRAGASDISTGAKAGDAAKMNAGLQALGKGITAYGLARKAIGSFVEQALSQKKMYVK